MTTETLIQRLAPILKPIRDYKSLMREIRTNPELVFQDAISLNEQQILKFTPCSPEAHHYFGELLMDYGFYYHAHLLFDKGLRLNVHSSKDEFQTPNLHRMFHFDLWGLINEIQTNTEQPIEKFGFPMHQLPFEFGGEEQGYVLPNFECNVFNQNHDDDFQSAENMHEGIKTSKERKLGTIHYHLGCLRSIKGKIHKADNCSYLEYVKPSD